MPCRMEAWRTNFRKSLIFMENFLPSDSTWKDLEEFVSHIRSKRFNPRLFEAIERHPMRTDSIDIILFSGLKFVLDPSLNTEAVIRIGAKEKKTLYLNGNLTGYIRDKVFFHELVHLFYGELSSDVWIPFELSSTEPYELETIALYNRAIVEREARRLRAQPEILRHAINSFKLQPCVYDVASQQAFPEVAPDKNQLLLPFENDNIEDVLAYLARLGALMD